MVEAVLARAGSADAAAVVAVLEEWRTLVRAAGGQAVIRVRALAVKVMVPVWMIRALRSASLQSKIKSRLDPNGLLNPGRFVGGI